LRSYNYSLHNLEPLKLKTLPSMSCILSRGFFLLIPSPVVFCLPQYLSLSCSDISLFCIRRRILYCTRSVLSRRRIFTPYRTVSWQTNPLLPQSSSNPLKVALGVPSRRQSVEQLIFPCCHANVFLVTARTKVYLAADWQWTSILNAWESVYRGLLSN
jgi:hypothetical protein